MTVAVEAKILVAELLRARVYDLHAYPDPRCVVCEQLRPSVWALRWSCLDAIAGRRRA